MDEFPLSTEDGLLIVEVLEGDNGEMILVFPDGTKREYHIPVWDGEKLS